MPADLGPRTFAITTPEERARLAFFPARLTPDLVTGLDDYARDRPAGHGITSEPASWQPPAFLLDDLYNGQKLSIRPLSHQLGTGRKLISGLLAEYGIPRRSGPARPPVDIDRNWLHQQYVLSRRTLPDIAAELGISTAYMTRRAKNLGIPLRGRGTPSHARSLRNPAQQPDTSHQNGKQAR
jgi:hypothetical protein